MPPAVEGKSPRPNGHQESTPIDSKNGNNSAEEDLLKERVAILPSLIAMKGLLNHHIASFDHLVLVEMKRIILNDSNREIKSSVDPDFFIRYTNIWVESPKEVTGHNAARTITPHECRLQGLTYKGDIFVDVEYTKREGNVKKILPSRRIRIGSIPIMLRSRKCNLTDKTVDQLVAMRECPLDPGGYFVVKGVERVCLVQEQQSKNRIIIESDDHGNIVAQVQSKTHYSISKCQIVIKKSRIYLQHRSLTEDIPIIIVLKAFGMESDQMIVQHIGSDEKFEKCLYPCFEQALAAGVFSQDQALAFLGERRKETYDDDVTKKQFHRSPADEAADFLANVLLCHVREGGDGIRADWNFRHKALYVCVMVRRMIEAINDPAMLDDRDFYGNKRFETTGTLMSLLFEDLLKQFNRAVRTAADQHLSKKDASKDLNLALLMEAKSDIIDKRMVFTLSTGNWDLKRFNMSRAGVTQVLSRQSYIAALGMMTRLASSFEKTRKVSGPRALQPSQWGMVCPCDTPEGESCGLVKNFALLSQVTLDQEVEPVRASLINLGVEEVDAISARDFLECYTVFLNGTIVGIHRSPNTLCQRLRVLRRSGRLHPHVSMFIQPLQRCVHVGCDGGRIVRLYIVVRNGVPQIDHECLSQLQTGLKGINDFLVEGRLEFVDVNEANDCLIAVYPRDITPFTTHLEVEPFSLLGVVAGIIPYPHNNQSARNSFQCAMGKQALGAIGYNQMYRTDTVLNIGAYPQRPLCRSAAMGLTDYEKLGAGINATVCVMSYSGYDIEDAQIYNRSALDRGYGRCIVLRKHETQLKHHELFGESIIERSQPPPQDKHPRNERYHGLDVDGIVSKGVRMTQGDILVNKFTPSRTAPGGPVTFRPQPLTFKGPAPAIVDHVILAPDGLEPRDLSIKIVTREVRVPEPGDKFSSRHGQKGVVGLITDGINMPFSERGIVPDMIMNPHGFPSRMTVGKLLELMSGKAGVLKGCFGHGTAFGGDKIEDISNDLLRFGYHYQGKDLFYCGLTGEMMPGFVFCGPIYYQRLKHMVIEKMHARSTGPKSMLTRQPTEGRARDGGLRVGEMERDCMVGYGAAMLLNERLLKSSDSFFVDVCKTCGNLGYSGYCQYCKSGSSIATVNMPYAFKLLIQEMHGMGIAAKLVVDDIERAIQ
jgi:DNA-directed RNA polymerase III subunit RPC2